jgi:hypothetical protein
LFLHQNSNFNAHIQLLDLQTHQLVKKNSIQSAPVFPCFYLPNLKKKKVKKGGGDQAVLHSAIEIRLE